MSESRFTICVRNSFIAQMWITHEKTRPRAPTQLPRRVCYLKVDEVGFFSTLILADSVIHIHTKITWIYTNITDGNSTN